jgi:hypothetical protein
MVSKRGRFGTCVFALLVLMSSCFYVGGERVIEGRRIDPTKVSQIIIGKSSRSNVYQLLGPPHSQFQGQVEFQEGSLRGFFAHMENRYLSSLDDNHYVILYRFVTTEGRAVGGTAIVVTIADTKIALKSDELLILLDKATDVVVDMAYIK